jgi:hypothetical protein
MRKIRIITLAIIATFLTVTVPARGQEKEAPQKPPDNRAGKVIQIKYADPERIRVLLSLFPGGLRVDDRMKVLTAFGSPAEVEAIEEAVEKLDVPPPPTKNAELTAYFLQATAQQIPASDLPPELNEVASQLKKVFNFRGFRLLNSTMVRTRDGEKAIIQGAAGPPPSGADFYLQINQIDIGAGEKEPIIHLHGLNFSISATPTPSEGKLSTGKTSTARIATDIDVPVGQKVVVGKTSFEMSNNAVVLVLTARVVD